MVCANCGSESHRTGGAACQNYFTLCAQSGHRQKRGTCPYRVCSTCGETGHSARECNPRCKACGSSDHRECNPRCKACGSSDHRNSSSFACPEHKCSKCKGALDPKGHNKNNCPQQSVHSAKKLVMMKSDAQRDRVLHVVIERTSLRRTLNVLNTYAQHAAKKVTITRISPPVNKSDRPFCARMSIQNCQHMQLERRRNASAARLL